MQHTLYFGLLLAAGCSLIVAQNFNLQESPGPRRQVEVFVNVYDHPKTGFTCAGKAPGQYYADPATKCAVYYVCIPNPTGTLSAQSFACPNGTIFSQATRVCRPHEEVFCDLATRYYDNPKGHIDEKSEFDALPVPVTVPLQAPAAPAPRRQQSPPRSQPVRQPAPAPAAPAPLPPAAPQPVTQPRSNSNLFNSNPGRFRNSRVFSAPSTTSTTPAPPPPPAPASNPGAPLGDYEYDYGDYGNETGLANAASTLHAQIIENIAEAIAKESKEAAAAAVETTGAVSEAQPSVTDDKKVSSRRKREAEPWMLSRRKGQLMEAISDVLAEAPSEPSATGTSFTCEDKISGVAYADMDSDCSKFYVCVSIAKGKLWSYHLACDAGKRFNQALGMCDAKVSDKTCARSERYYAYNKWHKASKKHFLDSVKKMSTQQ